MVTFTQNLFAGRVAEPASKLRSKYRKKKTVRKSTWIKSRWTFCATSRVKPVGFSSKNSNFVQFENRSGCTASLFFCRSRDCTFRAQSQGELCWCCWESMR